MSLEWKIFIHDTSENINISKVISFGFNVTLFRQGFHYFSPWKNQVTRGFLMLSGGVERKHWPEIGYFLMGNLRHSLLVRYSLPMTLSLLEQWQKGQYPNGAEALLFQSHVRKKIQGKSAFNVCISNSSYNRLECFK